MSGLSEWAAGTLHNVRNGLSPLTATTWQVQQLFEGAWLKNIETAAKELADSETTPERREKLNTFLVGSAPRFVEAAKKTTDLTANINEASQSVIDIVAEFESYAHRKTKLEPIDVRPLIEAVAKSTIGLQTERIELVLPQTSALITGNEVILRQIISNILVNAVEAMESQKNRPRIEFSIAPNDSNAAFTRIAISDNGEGLEAGRLESIFRRGVSTRTRRNRRPWTSLVCQRRQGHGRNHPRRECRTRSRRNDHSRTFRNSNPNSKRPLDGERSSPLVCSSSMMISA